MGYSEGLSFYALRRRSAAELTRKLGADTARDIMNHGADTRTMEESYLDLGETVDLTAALLPNEHVGPAGQSEELLANNANLAIHALGPQVVKDRISGAQLDSQTRLMLAQDPNYDCTRPEQELKLYQRRARYAAKKVLLSKEHKQQYSELSILDIKRRYAQIQSSSLVDFITKKAIEVAKTISDEEIEDEDDDDEVAGVPDEQNYEQALEDQDLPEDGEIVREADEDKEDEGEEDDEAAVLRG